ncbi:MAG: protein phosphatase 2C domain-containing protein [Chitinophagaceae bacterium]
MDDVKQVVNKLFESNNIKIPANKKELFNKFLASEENINALNIISQNQDSVMARWKVEERIADIVQQPIRMLNATVGKSYETKFDFDKNNWKDISEYEFQGLEEAGLTFDKKTQQIIGNPTQSGDLKFVMKFKIEGQPDDAPFNEKPFILIINHDPKSLWKKLESDKSDPYWKEDEVTLFEAFRDKHILVSCKRGRSHANVGSFREDDFAFKELANEWNIVVVGDGAGSARISRKGSAMACNGIVEYFSEKTSIENMLAFDDLMQQHANNPDDETQNKINHFVYNNLGGAALKVHKNLEEFAAKEGFTIKDLNSTLVFTLYKKYDSGYAFLSFGVGDCPMAVLDKDISEVTLLNWIDVGDYGGGTRFINMPEIFQNEKFFSRFSFKMLDEFSYLILMSDGIYDPKFVVESNLPKVKNWEKFLEDINGKNEDKIKVELKAGNADIVNQFSAWMDFWSVGNHDDRTLAIVF